MGIQTFSLPSSPTNIFCACENGDKRMMIHKASRKPYIFALL